MKGITTEQKRELCEAYNNDRVRFSQLAYEYAGDNADSALSANLDRLNELYKNDDLAFGKEEIDVEEVSIIQERILATLGVDIGLDSLGRAFLVQENDIVCFDNDSIKGIGIVNSITDDTVTIEFDPLKIEGEYEGLGIETFDKESLVCLDKETLSPNAEKALMNYIQVGRLDYEFEMGKANEKVKLQRE